MSNDLSQNLKFLNKEKLFEMDALWDKKQFGTELGTGVVETFTLHPSKKALNNPTVKGNQLKDSPKRSRWLG